MTQGDTLSGIVAGFNKKYGTTYNVNNWLALNPGIEDPNKIQAGSTLQMPKWSSTVDPELDSKLKAGVMRAEAIKSKSGTQVNPPDLFPDVQREVSTDPLDAAVRIAGQSLFLSGSGEDGYNKWTTGFDDKFGTGNLNFGASFATMNTTSYFPPTEVFGARFGFIGIAGGPQGEAFVGLKDSGLGAGMAVKDATLGGGFFFDLFGLRTQATGALNLLGTGSVFRLGLSNDLEVGALVGFEVKISVSEAPK